jgi:hypothetical protein
MQKIIIISMFYTILWADDFVGIVKSLNGKVYIKRQNKIFNLTVGYLLRKGDIIITKKKSSVGITFDDGSRLSLGENSIFNINRYIFQPSKNKFDINLKLLKGKALFNSGKVGEMAPESVKFNIPEGVIGIRGTEFLVEAK